MAGKKLKLLKKKISKKLGFFSHKAVDDNTKVRAFKTEAWQARSRAELYHSTTVAAASIFNFVRVDLYLDYLRRFAAPGARILDLGCGSGLISKELAKLGYEVVSCDVSQGMLDVLERERGDLKLETRCGDAYAIPAADGEFDMVVSRMFIQHFVDWPKIVAEMARVTRPGGHVIFDFGNKEHYVASGLAEKNDCGFHYNIDPKNPGSYYAVASEDEMRAVVGKLGMETVEISPTGLLFCNGFLYKKFGAEGVAKFDAELGELLRHEAARDLMTLLEKDLMPLLPKSVTYCNITVLRK